MFSPVSKGKRRYKTSAKWQNQGFADVFSGKQEQKAL